MSHTPNELPIVAITHGDPNGIGYEVIFKTFEEQNKLLQLFTPIIYGSKHIAEQHLKALHLNTNLYFIKTAEEARVGKINFLCCTKEKFTVEFGKVDPVAGQIALEALESAIKDMKKGLVDVLVTAPINKASIQSNQFHFCGHTEYLEDRLGSEHGVLMILQNELMRIALATTHVPLKDVSQELTPEVIELKVRQLQYSLCHDYLVPMPRIAVLSENPHCGDHGTLGDEEETIITPTLQKLLKEGKHIYGPYSADGFFGSGLYNKFDGILALYHDQGLAPFKALSMDDGVNFTAGLNYVRTSPDHGTAFDIAGKGIASASSMRTAIFTAIDIFRNRIFDAEAHKNPLPKLYKDLRDENDRGRRTKRNDDSREDDKKHYKEHSNNFNTQHKATHTHTTNNEYANTRHEPKTEKE